MSETKLGGRFTFPGTSLTVKRIGYGAMQLAGPGVWGPPKDPDGAVAVLRAAGAAGVDPIATAAFYRPPPPAPAAGTAAPSSPPAACPAPTTPPKGRSSRCSPSWPTCGARA